MRTKEQVQLDALIKDLYTAGQRIDDLSFSWILEKIVEDFGCNSTGIISANPNNNVPFLTDQYAIDPKYVTSYNKYFNQLDSFFAVLGCKSLKAVSDHVTVRNIPQGNNKWNEFTEGFIKPQKMTKRQPSISLPN